MSPAELAALPAATRSALALLIQQERTSNLGFRAFAESADYCRLNLSALVAGIMDASDGGRPARLTDAECERHFGCALAALPRTRARTVVVRAGGRGGKTSRLLAPKALHAAWTVPVPLLAEGEEAYAVLVAPTMKLARQSLSFCRGYVDGSPVLSRAKVSDSAEHIALRRPNGTRVRVEVFAAGRGGAQLRAKTLVFAGFDEAAFFRDESTGVVNDAELYRAVLQRVVPGGQAWLVSTPWLAGVGLIEEFIAKEFGSHEHALCAVAPTRALNPNWDPDRLIEADLRAQDPDAAEREIDAVPMAAGSQLFFTPEAIKAAVDENAPLTRPARPDAHYGAGGDLGLRRDSSALAVAEQAGDRYALALLDELRPTPGVPLKTSAVLAQFAPQMGAYGCGTLVMDAFEREAAVEHLAPHGMSPVAAPEGQAGKAETYLLFRRLLNEGRLALPNHPRLLRQLRNIVAKPQPGGGLAITSPRTGAAGGGHGDLVSAAVLAVWALAKPAQRRTLVEEPWTNER